MALSGYEKQKRWREKNRALYNLQQRNRRKQKRGDATLRNQQTHASFAEAHVEDTSSPSQSRAATTVQPAVAAKPTVEELREMIERENERVVEDPPKQLIYRDDYGRVITDRQWETLQAHKRKAKEGGYVLDEYSQ